MINTNYAFLEVKDGSRNVYVPVDPRDFRKTKEYDFCIIEGVAKNQALPNGIYIIKIKRFIKDKRKKEIPIAEKYWYAGRNILEHAIFIYENPKFIYLFDTDTYLDLALKVGYGDKELEKIGKRYFIPERRMCHLLVNLFYILDKDIKDINSLPFEIDKEVFKVILEDKELLNALLNIKDLFDDEEKEILMQKLEKILEKLQGGGKNE